MANSVLGELMRDRGITVTPNFQLSSVNGEVKTIESFAGGKIEYDLLCSLPVNLGPRAIEDSGLGNGACYAVTDDHNLKSKKVERIYAVGDVENLHTSKAGFGHAFRGRDCGEEHSARNSRQGAEARVRRPHELLHRNR